MTTFVGIAFLLGSAAFLYHALVSLGPALASRNWPRAHGVVTKSMVESRRDADSTLHRPVVAYRFTVDGQELTGEEVCFGAAGRSSSIDVWSRRVVQRYPVGAAVWVHHDPANPRRACLEPGVQWPLITSLLIGISLLGVGAYMLVAGSSI